MNERGNLGVPIAIVIAGALIAISIFFVYRGNTPADSQTPTTSGVRGIQPTDHVLGNPGARILIIEYSDPECPYCKEFHTTMRQIIDEYGASGAVAWVYRHYPIAAIHSKAPKEAEALECAYEQGGNASFWKYADALYTTTPSNNKLDIGVYNNGADTDGGNAGELSALAGIAELDVDRFEDCLQSGRQKARVAIDTNEAEAQGNPGTPYNVLIADGEQVPFEGAQPFETMKGVIDALLSQ